MSKFEEVGEQIQSEPNRDPGVKNKGHGFKNTTREVIYRIWAAQITTNVAWQTIRLFSCLIVYLSAQ